MADVTEPVLAISNDDTFLHIGRSGNVTGHLKEEAPGRDFEYYDATGRCLTLTSTGLAPVPGSEPDDLDRQVLVDRIDAVAAHNQLVFDRKAREAAAGETVIRWRMPRFQGPLADVLTTIAELAGSLPSASDPHQRGRFHNLWHP